MKCALNYLSPFCPSSVSRLHVTLATFKSCELTVVGESLCVNTLSTPFENWTGPPIVTQSSCTLPSCWSSNTTASPRTSKAHSPLPGSQDVAGRAFWASAFQDELCQSTPILPELSRA